MSSVVYAVRDPVSNKIKFGFAEDFENRLKDIQCGNPNTLELVYKVNVPTHLKANEERKAHNYFKDLHYRGEWYSTTSRQAIDYLDTVRAEYVNLPTLDEVINIKKRYRKGVRKAPPCFFYEDHQAQDKGMSNPKTKDSSRYRTMTWYNINESHPSYAGKNKNGTIRVYISGKKHQENMLEMNSKETNKSNLNKFFE